MEEARYITEVENIDSEIDFTMGENELSFRLKMRAEYIKLFAGRKSTLFSIEFWTGWHKWTTPPYDEDNMTEQDIKDWFNDNSLSDGIVRDEHPELWNIDFYGNDVPVHYPGSDPRTEICKAIEEVWDGADFDINVFRAWKNPSIEGAYTWPDGSVMIYEITPEYSISISGTLGDGEIHLDEEMSFYALYIEDDVKSIGANNFSGWKHLSKVTLPEGLKTIGRGAFSGCDKITEIRFWKGLESIGSEAFRGCSSLELVTFPESMRIIEDNAFKDCGNLKLAVMPRSHFVKLGDGALGKGVKQINRPYRNTNNALISIGEIRPNEYHDYYGCTVDVHVTVYDAEYRYSYSFWLLDQDTGWTGESMMDSIFESELECNPDFDEDMNLCNIYTEEELEEMAWDYIMDGYEFRIEDCPFLGYIRKFDDVIYGMYDAHFDDGGDIEDQDIDCLLWRHVDEFWSDLEVEDFIDFDAMADEKEVEGENWWGKDDYIENLVEDFEKEVLREKVQNCNVGTPEAAISYCKEHPADCLLLPYAICKGMLETHFVKSRRLRRPRRVNDMLQETDWTDSAAAEATLLKIRNYLLKGLKVSRWVDVDNVHYSRYENCDWIVSEAHDDLEALVNILSMLCPANACDIRIERKFDLGTDRSADIRRLREEYNVVIPEKIAYDFLVDGTMRTDYSAMKLHRESDYYNDGYDKNRLEFIQEDVFPIVEGYLEAEGNGRFFDAARTLKDYDGDTFVRDILDAESDDDYYRNDGEGNISSHGINYFCYDTGHHYCGSGDGWKEEKFEQMQVEVRSNGEGRYRGLVHIPSNVLFKGSCHSVTCIQPEAFMGCEEIRKVVIDDGLIEIGRESFKGCNEMTEIILPTSLKVIEDSAFENCISLKGIFIPRNVEDIDISCFEGCSHLEEILVDDANPTFMSVAGILCDRSTGHRIYAPDANKEKESGSPVLQGVVVEEGHGIFTVDGIRYRFGTRYYWMEEFQEHREMKSLAVLALDGDAGYSGKVEIPSKVMYHNRWCEVTEVGIDAFKDCPELIEVVLPDTIRCAPFDFSDSPRLEAVNVDGNNRYFASIDGVLYDKEIETAIFCPKGRGGRLEIPSTVKTIRNTIKNCTLLKSVVIPESVKEMWCGVFNGCTDLEEIVISCDIEQIGDGCFNGCSSLNSVILGEGIKHIGEAFKGCKSLKKIVLPDSLETVHRHAFDGCPDIESVRFPDGGYFGNSNFPNGLKPWAYEPFIVEGIYYRPVYNPFDSGSVHICARSEARVQVDTFPKEELEKATRRGVKFVKIPAEVEQYGFKYRVVSFKSDCAQFPDLQRLELPSTIGEINIWCPCLKEIIIDTDNTEYAAVDGILYTKDMRKLLFVPRSMNLAELAVRDGVEIIAEKALEGCCGVESVLFSDSVRIVERQAFYKCSSLRKVRFNSGLENIKSQSFAHTALTRVNLPSSLTDLGQRPHTGLHPFYGCDCLKEFTVEEGGSFETIGGVLYEKTTSGLKLIYCPPGFSGRLVVPDGVIRIGDDSCQSVPGLEAVEMPDSVEYVGGWAFAHCSTLREVKLSRNLRKVGYCAFRECPSLEELDFTRCNHYFGYDDIDTSAFSHNPQLKLLLPTDLENKRQYFEREKNERKKR